MGKVKYFDDPVEFWNFMADSSNEVYGIFDVSDEMICASYKKVDEFIEECSNTNPVIAAYTTCHARLKLYSYLEALQERVLYFDTDSVIFLTQPGDPRISTGDHLGDLTSELDPGVWIKEFVSGGPKQYGYQTSDGKTVLKIRGLSLTSHALKVMNYEELRRLVKTFVKFKLQDLVKLQFKQICRQEDHLITTKTAEKTYKTVYDKRRVLSDFTTLPYGY